MPSYTKALVVLVGSLASAMAQVGCDCIDGRIIDHFQNATVLLLDVNHFESILTIYIITFKTNY